MNIVPLSATCVDWNTFLSLGKQVTGHTISSGIERYGFKRDLGGLLASMFELITGEQKDQVTTFAEACGLYKHIHASFLVVGFDEFFRGVREETDLAISTTSIVAGQKVAIISGTLDQWKLGIVNCSSDRMSSEVRIMANQFMKHFEAAGLSKLWADVSKVPMPDRTFKLLPK